MDQNAPPSDEIITERDLMIGALIVAVALVTFALGYWAGRDIGSVLFN